MLKFMHSNGELVYTKFYSKTINDCHIQEDILKNSLDQGIILRNGNTRVTRKNP